MKPYIRTGLIISFLALLLTAGIGAFTWQSLPAAGDIPVHWGPDGTPDQFADRSGAWIYLAMLPASVIFSGLLMALVPQFDPRQGNIDTGRRAYLATWTGTMILLVLVQAGICISMLRGNGDTGVPDIVVRLMIAGSAGLIVLIGNYLPKTRSSFMFGIRTPWTLSSDAAWEKTHRFAGPLFMAAGLLGIIGAFVLSGIWVALQLTILTLSAALIAVIYSFFAWRSAADRDEGSGFTI